MTGLSYFLVDVFTDHAFGGNQLAVFPDGRGLSTQIMQALAKELNLSETTFVLPPADPTHDYAVRIFTQTTELPMAGHPTIGTTFVLAHQNLISLKGDVTSITLEEKVGPIPVTIFSQGDQIKTIQMQQPLPQFGPEFTDRESIAQMLSLESTDLDFSLPIQVVSCGVPFLYVPVKSLKAAQKIRFRQDVWEQALHDFASRSIFVFTHETVHPTSTVHSRMFAPDMGIGEDPATGGASGPLGAYLCRYRVLQDSGPLKIISEQGLEMGRPSFIEITIEHQNTQITRVLVGGQSYFMGSGTFELPE